MRCAIACVRLPLISARRRRPGAFLFWSIAMSAPTSVLMPKATAVWLFEETSLTFDQIAAFCGLHPLEVQGIANDEVAKGIRGVDPIAGGFLAREEIEKGEKNPDYRLKALDQKRVDVPQPKRKGARYTPIARRGDKPDAVAWFLRNHPEVPDSQIVKLIGTTKSTIDLVRNRQHWNSTNIKPVDPVSLGLCSQIELDAVVMKAAEQKAREEARKPRAGTGATLRPASETVAPAATPALAEALDDDEDALEDDVLADAEPLDDEDDDADEDDAD
jgi:uncharacterized protein